MLMAVIHDFGFPVGMKAYIHDSAEYICSQEMALSAYLGVFGKQYFDFCSRSIVYIRARPLKALSIHGFRKIGATHLRASRCSLLAHRAPEYCHCHPSF
jgi:hypothetical protein